MLYNGKKSLLRTVVSEKSCEGCPLLGPIQESCWKHIRRPFVYLLTVPTPISGIRQREFFERNLDLTEQSLQVRRDCVSFMKSFSEHSAVCVKGRCKDYLLWLLQNSLEALVPCVPRLLRPRDLEELSISVVGNKRKLRECPAWSCFEARRSG